MKTGTKSLLIGAHQFLLHPFFVLLGYIRLYGFPFDPRVWIAILIHDWGYWGKPNMDGPEEGKTHAVWAAKVMSRLFDKYEYEYRDYTINEYFGQFDSFRELQKSMGWEVVDIIAYDEGVNVMYQRKQKKWYNYMLYHSRYYCNMYNEQPSKLCYADKMAFLITPSFLYLPMAKISSEIYEYMANTKYGPGSHTSQWLYTAKLETSKWLYKSRHGTTGTKKSVEH